MCNANIQFPYMHTCMEVNSKENASNGMTNKLNETDTAVYNKVLVVQGFVPVFERRKLASGGLRSQNFDFLTKKKFLRKCSYLRNQTSHRVGSGVKTTVGPRATRMTLQIKCISSSFQDRLCFIKPKILTFGPKIQNGCFRPFWVSKVQKPYQWS